MMNEVYIINALRTPIGLGKPEKGWLWPMAPVDLAASVLKAVVTQSHLEPDVIDDVIALKVPGLDAERHLVRLRAGRAAPGGGSED